MFNLSASTVAAVHKSNSKILAAVKDKSFSFGLPAEMENILLVSMHDQTWRHVAASLRVIQAKALKFILRLQGEQQGGLQWQNTPGKQGVVLSFSGQT